MTAYYNENDRFAAAWLRELIKDGLIAPGVVDDRSIEDVTPNDLRPFRQCHFFAGVGIWSLAARLAGWRDDAPLWTGSCPCQPFSQAGKRQGSADKRHLWPAFHYLIEQCRPEIVAGEQVTGADGDTWFDLVSVDLDATGYAFGVAETSAAGFGAPHERSRNYWLAHRIGAGLEGHAGDGDDGHQPGRIGAEPVGPASPGGLSLGLADAQYHDGWADQPVGGPDRGAVDGGVRAAMRLAHPDGDGREPGGLSERQGRSELPAPIAVGDGEAGDVDYTVRLGRAAGRNGHRQYDRLQLGAGHGGALAGGDRPGPTNGWWRDADWLLCRDERWRPVEPASFPLADAGTFRNRVGLLRGAGNAITIGQAEGFMRAVAAVLGR